MTGTIPGIPLCVWTIGMSPPGTGTTGIPSDVQYCIPDTGTEYPATGTLFVLGLLDDLAKRSAAANAAALPPGLLLDLFNTLLVTILTPNHVKQTKENF